MTPEERQLLSGLFDRLRSADPGPIDQEAMNLINDSIRANPKAAYVMAQSVLVQEEMLNTASARVEELEKEVASLKKPVQSAPSAFAPPRSALGSAAPRRMGGGMGGGMGRNPGAGMGMAPGGNGQGQPYGQPYGQPSGMQVPRPGAMGAGGAPSPWGGQAGAAQQGGGGGSFLKGALGAAVGVAGGMLLANQLSSMFGGGKAQAETAKPAEAAGSPATIGRQHRQDRWR